MVETINLKVYEVNVKGITVECNFKNLRLLTQNHEKHLNKSFFVCNETWEITLYTDKYSDFVCLSVNFHTNKVRPSSQWTLAYAALKSGKMVVDESRMEESLKRCNSYVFNEFISKELIILFFPNINDICTVVCLFYPSGTCNSTVNKVNVEIQTNQSFCGMQNRNREITKATETEVETSSDSIKILSEDIRNLYMNNELCDVKIKVGPKEFLAHRSILAARSTVFSSMFKHDMIEKEDGVIDVTDGDPESFEDFLKFLYSGKVENIEANYRNLYKTADKYCVNFLKNICVDQMSKTLKVETICDVLGLASMHNETQLLKNATTFFIKNAVCIIGTEQWNKFVVEKTSLSSEILIKLVKKTQLIDD